MTREEEIKEQSTKYMWKQRKSHFEGYDIEYAFAAGAQWADQYPKDNLVDIDKAWDWLTNQNGEHTKEDFIKAMKGER